MSEDDRIIKSYKASREVLLGVEGVKATRLVWMGVHGNLCLALRHPSNRGESRKILVEFVKELGKKLVEWGVLTEEQLKYTERIEAKEGSKDLRLRR